MKLFYKGKDGGKDSTVTGYWLIEWKSLFSVALLCFENGSRDAFHSHAFNSISWVLKGSLIEEVLSSGVGWSGWGVQLHSPSLKPVITSRATFHKVTSKGRTWVLTFRGPWSKQWKEYDPKTKQFSTLESGRKIVNGRE